MCYGVFEIIVTVQRDIRPFVGNGVELYEGFDRLPIVKGSLFLFRDDRKEDSMLLTGSDFWRDFWRRWWHH